MLREYNLHSMKLKKSPKKPQKMLNKILKKARKHFYNTKKIKIKILHKQLKILNRYMISTVSII